MKKKIAMLVATGAMMGAFGFAGLIGGNGGGADTAKVVAQTETNLTGDLGFISTESVLGSRKK